MAAPLFIGDEVSAAAYRLAGIATEAPDLSDLLSVFDDAVRTAGLVVISADYAAALPGAVLRDAVRRADPLIVIVPDGGMRYLPQDLSERVDRVLGIEQ